MRRLDKKTDYAKRLKMVKSGIPRATVRKSLANITVQLIKFEESGDKVLASASSKQLGAYGWKAPSGNLPAAYLTGLLAGLNAKKANVTEAVLDAGLKKSTKGSRIYAALKGLLDAGIKIAHDPAILPDEKRISGAHIAAYATAGGSGFSKYGVTPAELPKHFAEVKAKMVSGAVKPATERTSSAKPSQPAKGK
jgi:large subunit ribosomal protein L18